MKPHSVSLHASCIVIGDQGLLIEGPPNSGKSSLALALIALAKREGHFAALIGDDRILVEVSHTRLIARGHPDIQGKIEQRGRGITKVPYENACILRRAVTCRIDTPERFPLDEDKVLTLCGITLPRFFWQRGEGLDGLFLCVKPGIDGEIMTI